MLWEKLTKVSEGPEDWDELMDSWEDTNPEVETKNLHVTTPYTSVPSASCSWEHMAVPDEDLALDVDVSFVEDDVDDLDGDTDPGDFEEETGMDDLDGDVFEEAHDEVYEEDEWEEDEWDDEDADTILTATLEGRRFFWGAVGVMLALLMCVGLVGIWTQSEATKFGLAYSKATKDLEQLREERKRLNIQLEALRSPERLARLASQELGLQTPHREQFLTEKQVRRLLLPGKTRSQQMRLAQHTQNQ